MLSSDKPVLEFYYHNPHKLVLLVLNPFWLEFIEKGVRIDVRECSCEISVDYKSIAVVFSHMFENASKYSASDSTLRISFVENGLSVTIVFEMISLKIKPEEKDKIFDEEFSGEYAKGLALSGNGIGMSIVKNLLSLNKGSIELEIDTDPSARKTIMGIPFEKNIFKITLPKRGV
jgi:signal transduction histidine kinase